MKRAPLRSLHATTSLSQVKLDLYARLSSDQLIQSLSPNQPGALKTRPDGTIIDGHHRIEILRNRGIDVNELPREIVEKT